MDLLYFAGRSGRCWVILAALWLCGACTPAPTDISNKLDATSDNIHLVETDMSDKELAKNGIQVVYRFQTVPKVIAVISNPSPHARPANRLSAVIENLPAQNQRSQALNDISPSSNTKRPPGGCTTAYCEAFFDRAIASLLGKTGTVGSLTQIKGAYVDTGIVPATDAIEAVLIPGGTNLDGSPQDTWGDHATMIASLVSGVVNPQGQNVTHIYAPNIRTLSYRVTFSNDGTEEARKNPKYGSMQLAVALDMAIASGARIVNMSFSYSTAPDPRVREAESIVMSSQQGREVLFTVSAGNDNKDLTKTPSYPASYGLRNIVVVGSHTSDLKKAQSSNYGLNVDLFAQAANVQVNRKDGSLTHVGGTSFAAPLVGAAAALYWGKYPTASLDTLLADLFASAGSYPNDQSSSPTVKYGRLDAEAFISKSGSYTPRVKSARRL